MVSVSQKASNIMSENSNCNKDSCQNKKCCSKRRCSNPIQYPENKLITLAKNNWQSMIDYCLSLIKKQ